MAQYSKFPSFIAGIARKYFSENFDGSETKRRLNRTLEIYKEFVEEAPDIGGKDNNMSSNLYMALAVFAFYEAADRAISPEELKKLATDFMPKSIPVLSAILDFNKPRNQEKMRTRYIKYKALAQEKTDSGEWGNNWRVELNPHNRQKGVAFDLIGCPLADFAKKHGYLEIMPVLCDFDYLTASLMHARLIREHTVANGDGFCDFWYLGDKEAES